MKQELIKAADQENGNQQRASGIRNGSHQSNLRYTLQEKKKLRQGSVASETGKVTRASRITFIRETQSLRKTV